MSGKPLVLIVGATGKTARSVFDALLDAGTFRLAALVRSSSASKPAAETLKESGVEIRLGDLRDSVEDLQRALAGVDILVSLVSAFVIPEQKNVLEAAKKAGVGRVIPCDFGTACPPGRMALNDAKLEIQSFVRELGVPYTFIRVGWWMQLVFTYPSNSPEDSWVAQISRERHGDGNVKTAVTSFDDIGRFVCRIIADPRTINQEVFCWSEEVSLNECYPLFERLSGQKLRDLIVPLSPDEIKRRAAEGKAEFIKGNDEESQAKWGYYEYVYSIYVCGDNTLQKAKAAGAIDARELYPSFKPQTLEESAKQFYATPGSSILM